MHSRKQVIIPVLVGLNSLNFIQNYLCMKICFVWVKEFRNFNNLGLNLANDIKFKYQAEDNVILHERVEALPKNFFGKDITDVTGIIGKNGTGKSNALELICKCLKGSKTSLKTEFIIILKVDGGYTCYYNLYNNEIPKVGFKMKFEKYEGAINPLKVVFFSNVYDDRRNNFDKEIVDISVNNTSRSFGIAKTYDFGKQVKFINSKIFRTLNIEIPTNVQITNKVWSNKLASISDQWNRKTNFSGLRRFFKDRTRDLKESSKFVILLKYGFFLEIYPKLSRETIIRFDSDGEFSKELGSIFSDDKLYGFSTDEVSDILLDFIEKQVERYGYDENFVPTEHSSKELYNRLDLIRKQIYFIRELKYQISELELSYSAEGIRGRNTENFIFNYKSDFTNSFVNQFISLFEDCSFLDINWLGISSGHKAYLNLFSSIHNELRLTRTPNLLLCIDEGDLYLHPRWQIEFFDKLLSVLPTIYSGSIQLILTSHSPFLLSDLPKQNITILNNEKSESSSFDGINLAINTFGGNLYDLYSEPFFLGNRRTSDFAYDKIKYLIEKVELDKYTNEEKKELVKLTNILGDDIIKYRINSLLNSND
ncbi:hypothetical protein FLACOL7796_04676 [Flavobacterium collinsii]|uniref:Endonuclease GajA/Old nuclease/RecF-like AAA domain-containing protein n=2 Tax=Flavobacterium collinsii TaxID=1114861 RepID=A0ABM8KSE2_9FLAO|nr:hypothetical protein FLACOL7796_04676 [Flavobacterium collinsii]